MEKLTTGEKIEEYLSSGFEESSNPFIKSSSRGWGRYAKITGSLASLVFFFSALGLRFLYSDLSAFFLVFVYFLAGTEALIASIEDIKQLNINIDVLMTLAALLSVLIGSAMEGALLLVLFSLSESLEDMVTKKTKGALSALHKITPTTAWVIDDNQKIYPKSVREIALDTRIFVKVGDVIPLDGVIEDGSSFVNLMHLTGESIPSPKKPGDEVQAGSINTDGQLTIRVTKTSAESTLTKIIRLVTKAQENKPRVQQFLDRFGRRYATTVIILAILFGALIPFFFPWIGYLGFEGSIYRALAFLIAASPCALIIATPTAYLSAISSAAKRGVLLKGGTILDALARCTAVAFDKTGTLTTGKLLVKSIEPAYSGFTEEEIISFAASVEKGSTHPIAKAICAFAEKKHLSFLSLDSHRVIGGKGVEGTITRDGTTIKILVGSYSYILENTSDQATKTYLKENRDELHKEIMAFILLNGKIAYMCFSDDLRKDVADTMQKLGSLSLKTLMLTGDHQKNGEKIAKQLAIDTYYAELKPEDKLSIVQKLTKKEILAMVGDGINDAPALSGAHVGIAMGEIGSDSAIEASDVVLLCDELSMISWLFHKAKKTVRIVRENLFLALLVILFATTFSLFGFIPLWLAVVLHEGSTVVVGLNSLRLLQK